MSHVLVVDDDINLLRTLRINLTAHGYTALTAADGTTALHVAAATPHPQVIVLDLGLPDLSGVEVLRQLRRWSNTPVVVLSARSDSTDKVDALDAGADDYVTKPFGMPELLARIRATLRRTATDDAQPTVTTADFTLDLAAKKVHRGDTEIRLTPTEWGILELLVRHAGKLVTQQHILNEVWGPSYHRESHYLRVYLAHLRRKLEPDPTHPRYLITDPGRGYRFEPSETR